MKINDIIAPKAPKWESHRTEGEVIGPCKTRKDIGALCQKLGCNKRGVELGVAKGSFTFQVHKYFDQFWSIDSWCDERHDTKQYERFKRKIVRKKITNINVVRSDFNTVVKTFDDYFFDFIYIDGYAKAHHQLRLNLNNWFIKLTPGGIFSGHDWQYPHVQEIINELASDKKLNLNVTGEQHYGSSGRINTEGPTWWFKT